LIHFRMTFAFTTPRRFSRRTGDLSCDSGCGREIGNLKFPHDGKRVFYQVLTDKTHFSG
jgi:hypothetical protein